MKITKIQAIEVMDSRGKPTVRTFVTLEDGSVHNASIPSGASTGTHEAVELRDGDKSYHHGQGVTKAVAHVNGPIAKALIGQSVTNPKAIDQQMLKLDGTENKAKLGANAILSVSEAVVRAAAHINKKPLWQYINEYYFTGHKAQFPRLMVNVINGGKHADWTFDIQEFMIVPTTNEPSKAVRVACEIFQQLGKQIKAQGFPTLVGDEGGYSPKFSSNEEVFENIIQAAMTCGYKNTVDYNLAIDSAASEWYENGSYIMKKTNETLSGDELIEYYKKLAANFKLISIEDPFAEDDWTNFQKLTEASYRKYQVIGDDIFTTNPKRIARGIEFQSASAVLIKLNQIGTVMETVEAIKMSQQVGWKIVISHRSGETEDAFIADFAYACGADFIKTGSMSRSERLCKYNRLIEIEHGI